jgi:hypothetical protein
MSWFSVWLKKGFSISFRLPWLGEKNLPDPQNWNPDISKKTIYKEIDPNKEKKQ